MNLQAYSSPRGNSLSGTSGPMRLPSTRPPVALRRCSCHPVARDDVARSGRCSSSRFSPNSRIRAFWSFKSAKILSFCCASRGTVDMTSRGGESSGCQIVHFKTMTGMSASIPVPYSNRAAFPPVRQPRCLQRYPMDIEAVASVTNNRLHRGACGGDRFALGFRHDPVNFLRCFVPDR